MKDGDTSGLLVISSLDAAPVCAVKNEQASDLTNPVSFSLYRSLSFSLSLLPCLPSLALFPSRSIPPSIPRSLSCSPPARALSPSPNHPHLSFRLSFCLSLSLSASLLLSCSLAHLLSCSLALLLSCSLALSLSRSLVLSLSLSVSFSLSFSLALSLSRSLALLLSRSLGLSLSRSLALSLSRSLAFSLSRFLALSLSLCLALSLSRSLALSLSRSLVLLLARSLAFSRSLYHSISVFSLSLAFSLSLSSISPSCAEGNIGSSTSHQPHPCREWVTTFCVMCSHYLAVDATRQHTRGWRSTLSAQLCCPPRVPCQNYQNCQNCQN